MTSGANGMRIAFFVFFWLLTGIASALPIQDINPSPSFSDGYEGISETKERIWYYSFRWNGISAQQKADAHEYLRDLLDEHYKGRRTSWKTDDKHPQILNIWIELK